MFVNTLLNAIPVPVFYKDTKGHYIGVNKSFEEFLGQTQQELVGKSVFEIAPRQLAEVHHAKDLELLQHSGSQVYDSQMMDVRGMVRDVVFYKATFTDLGGRVRGLIGAILDITERKRAEEALRRSQTELRAIYDNAPTMMCVLNASRQVFYANRAFTEFVGRPLEELTLEPACGVIGCLNALDDPRGCGHGPRCETCAVRLAMVDALATGRTHRGIEYRVTALRDGQPRDSVFLASVAPIEILGKSTLLLCLEDVTEQQWAEEVFRILSRFNQEILDALPAHICVLDEDGKIIAVNRGWRDFAAANSPLSAAAAAVDIGADYFAVCDAATGDDALMAREAVRGLRAVGRGEVPEFSFEYPCHSPDVQRWFRLRFIRLSDDSRPRVVVLHINITERKQGEIALRESEERYRMVVEDQTEVIGRVRADGTVTFINDAFCRFLGKTQQELQGQKWQPVAVSDDLPLIEAKLQTLSPANPVVMIENRVYSGTGEIRWMQFVNRGLFDRDGRRLELQAVGRDITERKRAEDALLLHTRQLEAIRAIGGEISRELDLAILLQIITERSAELMGAASGVVALWDKAAQILVPRAWFGPRERLKDLQWKPGEDLSGITNAATHTAALVAPLLFDDRLVGVIRIDRAADQQPFTEMDRQLLALFATQAAIAIENARLYAGVVRRSEETASLLRASRSLMAGLDLQETLRRIAEEACRIARSRHAVVLLRDREKQTLRLGAAVGGPPALVDNFARGSKGSLSAIVASTGQPLFIADCGNDSRNPYADEDRALGIVTYLGLPITMHGEVVGVLTVNTSQAREYTPEDLECLTSFANLSAIAIENARLFEEVRAGRERLRALSRRQLDVHESERRLLARELHDEVGQLLTGLKLTLDMVAGEASDTGQSLLRESQDLVGELIGHVRELSLNLRPALLDDLGLLPALLWQFERYTAHTRVRVDFEHAGLEGRPCRPEVETAAYRIVQEALTNVARHAEASEVQVRLWVEGGRLLLRIEDQGRGFEPTITLDPEESSGLAGMYERAMLLGGRLRIESSPGAGTRIQAELPLG
jgi:PAS domain S-box-containing protein